MLWSVNYTTIDLHKKIKNLVGLLNKSVMGVHGIMIPNNMVSETLQVHTVSPLEVCASFFSFTTVGVKSAIYDCRVKIAINACTIATLQLKGAI